MEQSKPALIQADNVAEAPLMILVAEDNHANRLLLSACLNGAPHALEFAENGQPKRQCMYLNNVWNKIIGTRNVEPGLLKATDRCRRMARFARD